MIKIIRIKNSAQMEQAFEIRRKVFVEEQQVDAAEEYEFEDESTHFLALNEENKTIGTARWREMPGGIKLERFAVLANFRNTTAGSTLLKAVIEDVLAHKPSKIYLHAQVQVIPFYEKYGFKVVGGEFSEAGIRHRKMVYQPGT
jgi:predicted GNAT family N-acyltransferase